MQDQTLISLAVVVSLTVLGSVYFFAVRQDGTVFSTLAVALAGLGGFHLGKKSNSTD